MQIDLNHREKFVNRHIGLNEKDISEMLDFMGLKNVDDLINETIPKTILNPAPLNLPEARNEHQFINDLNKLAKENQVSKSYIGLGYYNNIMPPVIRRNILENPGWYTAYTPYQAEIAQGRLEALVNFQTMVMDLTSMEIANASLLDEATAAAEAMSMLFSSRKGPKKKANKFFVDKNTFPQTISVLKTRSAPLGIELVIDNVNNINWNDEYFGLFLQYPDNDGNLTDHTELIEKAHQANILVVMAADLLSLTLLKSPGEMGAVLVFPWVMVDPMPHILPPMNPIKDKFPAGSLGYPLTGRDKKLTEWRCKPGSNIYEERKPHRIYVLHRFYWL